MTLFEKFRRLFLPLQPTHKCDRGCAPGKLYETPCLKPSIQVSFETFGISGWPIFCSRLFRCYFAVEPTDMFKLVAYDQPSKHRYCITIIPRGQILPGLGSADLKIDGKLCRHTLLTNFQRLLCDVYRELGDRKLYVECEIQ